MRNPQLKFSSFIFFAAFSCLFMLLSSLSLMPPTEDDTVSVTIEEPGVTETTANFLYSGVENFDNKDSGTFVSSFVSDPEHSVNGTYNGITVAAADGTGGVGGTGKFAHAPKGTFFELYLAYDGSEGLNYFGGEFTALDYKCRLEFYYQGVLVFQWGSRDVFRLLSNRVEYLGNPWIKGEYAHEPYLFINFYLGKKNYDLIKFGHYGPTGGCETDNHTLGRYTSISGELVTKIEDTCHCNCDKSHHGGGCGSCVVAVYSPSNCGGCDEDKGPISTAVDEDKGPNSTAVDYVPLPLPEPYR